MSKYLRFHGNRQQQLDRLRSQGWTVLQIKTAPIVVAFQNGGHGTWVKGWTGKADKPAFFHSFHNQAQAESWVSSYVAGHIKSFADKDARRNERKTAQASLSAADHWTVGDVIINSWGYEQTNLDYYQIVEVNAKTVRIRPVAVNYREDGFMSGQNQPRRNEFTGPAVLKRVDEHGSLAFQFGGCSKWDGKAQRSSHYA